MLIKNFSNGKEKGLYLFANDKSLWHFYFSYPDSIGLGSCMVGDEREKEIKENAIILTDSYVKEIKKYINSNGHGEDNNYKPFSKLLAEIFNITQEEIDDILGYDATVSDICSDFSMINSMDYRDCKEKFKQWNRDVERTKRYMKRFCTPYKNHVLIDIWPSEEDKARPTWPTESFLLHEFYNKWGDELDQWIKEAVEQYPNFNDFDLATYYIDKKLEEKYKSERNGFRSIKKTKG